MADKPFFSVLVTAYNRPRELERCLRSVFQQEFTDFEVVVADDASTDSTPAVLDGFSDPRLRVIRHEHNLGIAPARATAVRHARGEWFVMLDSDWTLYPHSLTRLRELIGGIPAGVRIIRSRLECEDGSVQPGVLPSGVTGYVERLRWMEEVAVRDTSSDAAHCMHSSVFSSTNYYDDRRGSLEVLWETDLARHERSLWVADILGKQYVDATNSHTRGVQARQVVPRWLREAPDDLWMAETMLKRHGAELVKHAPHVRSSLLERAATQAFLCGDRGAGLRYARTALRSGSAATRVWTTVVLGMVGPTALAYGKVFRRRGQALRNQRRSRPMRPTASSGATA
jgi:hypothetical protein